MKRIMVVGVSAGVGKSTFASELGKALNRKVYHLDAFYWKPNWVEAPTEEFSKAQQDLVTQEEWIIEGNYTATFEIRTERADTMIYLELPLSVCLYRVIKRWLTNLGKTRPDMGAGCTEKLDWAFIKFICTTYYSRKKSMKDHFQSFLRLDPQNEVIILKGKPAIQSYLDHHS